MNAKAKVPGAVVARFPSQAEQYQEPPLDLNELLVRRPAATYFVSVVAATVYMVAIHRGLIARL